MNLLWVCLISPLSMGKMIHYILVLPVLLDSFTLLVAALGYAEYPSDLQLNQASGEVSG